MELSDRRRLTRSVAARLVVVIAVTAALALGFFQVGPLHGLGATMATLTALCLPVAAVCLLAALLRVPADRLPRWLLLLGATGTPVLFAGVLIDAANWAVIALAAAVWLLVVGVIASLVVKVLRAPGSRLP